MKIKFNDYIRIILEGLEDDNVYVSYNSINLCEGDLRFIKQMSIRNAANYFYSDKNKIDNINTETGYAKEAGDPKPYRWYFPTKKEEFVQRLIQNKPIIFAINIAPNDSVLPITDKSKLDSYVAWTGFEGSIGERPEEIFEDGAYIVIHKDLNSVRHIVETIVTFYEGDWA